MSGIGLLGVPEPSAEAQRLFDDDMSELGYVMNVSGLWAYQPAITVFVALRIAFSTVNDALGASPDAALRSTAPKAVLDAVTFGRPIDDAGPGICHPNAVSNP